MLLPATARVSRARLIALVGVISAVLVGAQPAAAQHRARLSPTLLSKLTAGASRLSVVVEAPQAEVDRIAKQYGIRVTKRLDMGAVLSGNSVQVDLVAGDPNVAALTEDETVISTMAVTTQSTGANSLWGGGGRRFGGLTGQGIGVAVIDSGIGSHPDVARRLALSLDFTADEGVADGYGHGTHIAGIIAGSGGGSRSSDGTAYVGMAPGASLISLRVLAGDGTGYVSDVIEAIEWVVTNKARYKIRVINLSLGHAADGAYRDDALAQAVERAVSAGIVVVSSAGNLGKTEDGTPIIGAVVSPGYTPGALTVGALNTKGTIARSDDVVASYSSRGPVGDPDNSATWEIKPDIVAPGNAIVSTGLPGTLLWDKLPERHVTGKSGGTYISLSGSSMATAVVSGAVAQLLQLEPKLTPGEVKFALQFTAEKLDGFGIIEQGAGSLNVPLAAALIQSRYIPAAPTSDVIAGETIEASQISFANSVVAGRKGVVQGGTLIRGESGGVQGKTVVWGSRGGVQGDTVVWGSRGAVEGDTVVWGSRGSIWGDTVVWGSRGGVQVDTVVWGSRGGVQGDTVAWGTRGSEYGNTVLWGNTVVWGSRGGIDANTVVWGSRGSTGDPSLISGNTVVWGSRGGVSGDTVVWGSRGGGVSGDTVVWGSRGGVQSDTVVWGSRGVEGTTVVWGSRTGIVTGETVVWGSRGGVSGDTVVWGSRGGGVSGDTVVWGSRGGSVQSDTVVWGSRLGEQ